MQIKYYMIEYVEGGVRHPLMKTPVREQAYLGAKRLAETKGVPIHATCVTNIDEREIAIYPDGTVDKIWERERMKRHG